jgi:DNA-binding winged helix-turn-helix (wHTH) protein
MGIGSPQTCYRFGSFRLDIGSGLLFKDNHLSPLPVKAVETLRMLVENSGRTVRRDELMARVWADAHVEEANLTVTVSALRKALGDNRDTPLYIETIPKRGYRFIAPVTVEVDPTPATPAQPSTWRITPIAMGLACALLITCAVAALRPRTEPHVRGVVQLTHTGLVDTGPSFITDESRLYFTQRAVHSGPCIKSRSMEATLHGFPRLSLTSRFSTCRPMARRC